MKNTIVSLLFTLFMLNGFGQSNATFNKIKYYFGDSINSSAIIKSVAQLDSNYRRRQELKLASRTSLVGFSFGFGIKISKFKLSYSHANYHLAGGTNTFTLTTNFSDFFK